MLHLDSVFLQPPASSFGDFAPLRRYEQPSSYYIQAIVGSGTFVCAQLPHDADLLRSTPAEFTKRLLVHKSSCPTRGCESG